MLALILWAALWEIAIMLGTFDWYGLMDILTYSDWSRDIYRPSVLPIIACVSLACVAAGIMHYINHILSFKECVELAVLTVSIMFKIAVWFLGILFAIAGYGWLFIDGYILWPFKKVGSLFSSIGSWPLFLQIALGVIIGGGVVALMLAAILNKDEKN